MSSLSERLQAHLAPSSPKLTNAQRSIAEEFALLLSDCQTLEPEQERLLLAQVQNQISGRLLKLIQG